MTSDAPVLVFGARTELDRDELVSWKSWAQLQGEVLEQLALMYGDDHLTLVMLRKNTNKGCELCNMDLVHRLDGIIQYETRHEGLDRGDATR